MKRLGTEQATYPDLVQTIPQEISEIIGLVKTEALFQVDLEQMYQHHPDLASKLSAFNTSDQAAVLNHARQEYDPQGINRALFLS